jgi:hypothetical protein
MKNRNRIVAAVLILLVVIATGCHLRHNRVRTVKVRNDHSSLKIQYSGKVVFNEDGTAIEHLSPNGFVKYKKDDQIFAVNRDGNGGLSYKLYDGTRYLNYDDDDYAKEFAAKAIKEIAEHY